MTSNTDHRWALVLAAGSGTRLSSLTMNAEGETVPKQFCSLEDGPSLLRLTLARAFRVVPWSRTVVVVAANHRRHWERALPELPAENVIVQPENRGTAIGILLPLLHILNRDPDAQLVILPSDHHVDNEDLFVDSMMRALDAVDDDITLLGITPDHADPELGYIVGGRGAGGGRSRVLRFVEKPAREVAESLVAWGALWNSFVLVAQATEVLTIIAERYPHTVRVLCHAVAANDDDLLSALYRDLPTIDFSRDVVTPKAGYLKCLRVPSCGWTDLGTPYRVAECLSRLQQRPFADTGDGLQPVVLNLAEAHRRRQVRSQPSYEDTGIGLMTGELP